MKDLEVGSIVVEQHPYRNELLIDNEEENWEPAPECCIYKVPKHLRNLNEEAYTPQVISIGPLHHGNPHLADMEKQKKRYERRFRERNGITSGRWKKLENFVKDNKKAITKCYEDTSKLKSFEFEKMILLDAIFTIEYFLRIFQDDQRDFLVAKSWLRTAILWDLQLLENQIPYFALKKLYKIAFADRAGDVSPSFLTLCCIFFYNGSAFYIKKLEGLEIKHFTDLLRHSQMIPYLKNESKEYIENLPNAVKLYESGLKFKHIRGEHNPLLDIKFVKRKRIIPMFEVDELHIRSLQIYDTTETFFRNLMALEQCHYPSATHFCNYIDILDRLIDTKEDVDLLVEKGIIVISVGDHNEVAKMINRLGKNILHSESCFYDVAANLHRHYHNPWNRAHATLVNVYFSNPWRGTATVAAVILLVLTFVQTICSIHSVIYV